MKPSLILVHILLAVFLCGCSSKSIAIESDDVWKTDMSFTLFRKKLKNIGHPNRLAGD